MRAVITSHLLIQIMKEVIAELGMKSESDADQKWWQERVCNRERKKRDLGA